MLVDIRYTLGGKGGSLQMFELPFAKSIANMLVMPAQSLLSQPNLEIRLVQSLRTKAFSFTFTLERA